MLRVWVDGQKAGVIDRFGSRGTTFAYDLGVPPQRAVSLTMPVRTASWDTPHGLAPIFEQNIPEGALRERLRRHFAKATGTFDDFDILGIVGRTQIGRIRYSGIDAELSESVPFQSIDDILRARRGGDLFDHLLDTFAAHSGLSGVQPKVMIRGEDTKEGERQTFASATHIVKFWEAGEYPELPANEFFCLTAARAAGLDVPAFRLSDEGDALVIERFDLAPDGSYLGFEDFCVLNGIGTDKKYSGGYETRLFRRLRDFVEPAGREAALAKTFKLFVLNCALRNGDAHLKNWGLVYRDVQSTVTVAPVYDVVTTCAYLPRDRMALSLDGSPDWPDRKRLLRLGTTRADLTPSKVNLIFEEVAEAVASVEPQANAYFSACPHPEIGARIMECWRDGVASLGKGRIPPPAAA